MLDWLAHVFSSFVCWLRDRLPTIWLLLLFKQIGNPANTALRRPLLRGPEVKKAQKWRGGHAWKEAFASNPSTQTPVLWRFRYFVITKNDEKRRSHCLDAALLKLKFGRRLAGYGDVLSPGLRIHDCRSRGHRSDLLKVCSWFLTTVTSDNFTIRFKSAYI